MSGSVEGWNILKTVVESVAQCTGIVLISPVVESRDWPKIIANELFTWPAFILVRHVLYTRNISGEYRRTSDSLSIGYPILLGRIDTQS